MKNTMLASAKSKFHRLAKCQRKKIYVHIIVYADFYNYCNLLIAFLIQFSDTIIINEKKKKISSIDVKESVKRKLASHDHFILYSIIVY